MKTFEEQLDQFFSIKEKSFTKTRLGYYQRGEELPIKEVARILSEYNEDYAASLKPIVLKFEKAIEEHHDLWNDGGYCTARCAILCDSLAEVKKMLEGGGKFTMRIY